MRILIRFLIFILRFGWFSSGEFSGVKFDKETSDKDENCSKPPLSTQVFFEMPDAKYSLQIDIYIYSELEICVR